MATIQRYVNTASSGGDGTTNNTSGATAAFASLNAWEAAMLTGNAADDYIVDCCGSAADTTATTVNFAANSIIIRANRSDGTGFYDGPDVISSNHYRLVSTVGSPLVLSVIGVTVDGLQVHANLSGTSIIGISVSAGNNIIKNCRVLGHSNNVCGVGSNGTLSWGADGRTNTYDNNLIVNFTQGIYCRASNFFDGTVNIRHNTIYNNGSGYGIRMTDTSAANSDTQYNIYGNAIGNTGANVGIFPEIISSGGTGGAVYADNACSVASSTTDEIVLGTASDAWTSPGVLATSVFTVKDTSSSLYSAVNPTRVTEDITGFTRDDSNHDVGAFEFQAGVGGGGGTDVIVVWL